MSSIFLISFAIHIFVDYIYIYRFLDNNFFYSAAGSKIGAMSRDGPVFRKYKDVIINTKSKKTGQSIALILVFLISNWLIFFNLLSSNFIPVNIFGKVVDLVTFFGNKFNIFVTIYYLSYFVFLLIFCPKIIDFVHKKYSKSLENTVIKQTGILLGKAENGDLLYIDKDNLYQNLLITGSIGSGKTTGVMCNVCEALIKRGYGGVILDIKGNFVDSVENICEETSRMCDFKEISMKSIYSIDLLPKGLSNLEISAMIKQVITLISPSNNSDSYWLDKVQNVILNLLIIISYYTGGKKSIYEIHKLVVSEEYLNEKMTCCKENLIKGSDSEKVVFEMNGAISFIKNEYLTLDSRVKSIVKSEITRLTIPLVTEYEIYNKFCNENINTKKIDFKDRKQIVVLSIDVGKNKMLAQIVSVFLKLQFQMEVLQNIGQKNTVFFIADEYQEFVNVEDARFLSLSREAKCINVISTQSYSSIRNTLKDETATNVIIQNLVNKLWLRNDDNYTIQEIIKQLGKVNVRKETVQISEGAGESKKYLFRKGFKNKKSNISRSVSQVTNKENEYDENFFSRQLKTFEALSFIYDRLEGIIVKKIKLERWKNSEEKQNI